jgi:hypothetical protein
MIYKELPILGPDSHMASRAALAARKQGAYLAFHRELMSLNGPLTPAAIEDTGKKLGLDVARLKADMESKEVQGALTQNQRLANAIGVQSTPSFVIGGELISGAMDLTGFEELISKSRIDRYCDGHFTVRDLAVRHFCMARSARDAELDRTIALKFVRPNCAVVTSARMSQPTEPHW